MNLDATWRVISITIFGALSATREAVRSSIAIVRRRLDGLGLIRLFTVEGVEVLWARERFGAQLGWAIEDCRHLSVRLERDLLTAGQQVVRMPPKLRAQAWASARTRGKPDPIDALAVVRAYLREPDLPSASHNEVLRELKVLVDRREVLVGQRTATINRLLWRVHELDPAHVPRAGSLNTGKHQGTLADWLAIQPGPVAKPAHEELTDVIRLVAAIKELGNRIGERVRAVAPALLALAGCGKLTAAKLVGEAAGVTRFKCEAAFARNAAWRPSRSGQATPPADPHDPLGQPPTQRRPAPHRRHPDPHGDQPRAELLSPPPRRRRLHPRGAALSQTPTGPRGLRPPTHRSHNPPNRLPTGSGLK